jgi:hypothetical protein
LDPELLVSELPVLLLPLSSSLPQAATPNDNAARRQPEAAT